MLRSVVAVLGLLLMLGPLAQQERTTPAPPARTLAQLRAQTALEKQLARFFDSDGDRLLENGTSYFVPGFSGGMYRPKGEARTPEQIETCGADLIATGRVTEQRPLLNASETHLFTILSVRLTQVLKGVTLPGEGIVVATFGGAAQVDGRTITTRIAARPFALDGDYVLALHKIRGTGAYAPNPKYTALLGDATGASAVARLSGALSACGGR